MNYTYEEYKDLTDKYSKINSEVYHFDDVDKIYQNSHGREKS